MKYWISGLKKYADFSGRASRKDFWMFILINTLASVIIALSFAVIDPICANISSMVFCAMTFLPTLAVTVRRLHDIGKSGWFYLLGLVPVIGVFVLFVFLCKKSVVGKNQYGEYPQNPNLHSDESKYSSVNNHSNDTLETPLNSIDVDIPCDGEKGRILALIKSKYYIQMPCSGYATSWLSSGLGGTDKFGFLDYDVKKGLKWEMTFYFDKDKTKPFLQVKESKFALLDGEYEFKDTQTGAVLGSWHPKKRLLNFLLDAKYELVVDGKVIAVSPGESLFKLLLPNSLRGWMARKVVTVDGKLVAKVRTMATLGCGTVSVRPTNGDIMDKTLATSLLVLAGICGLQDWN